MRSTTCDCISHLTMTTVDSTTSDCVQRHLMSTTSTTTTTHLEPRIYTSQHPWRCSRKSPHSIFSFLFLFVITPGYNGWPFASTHCDLLLHFLSFSSCLNIQPKAARSSCWLSAGHLLVISHLGHPTTDHSFGQSERNGASA